MNLETQKDLLKAAMVATDTYLSVETRAKNTGKLTQPMIKEFVSSYDTAYSALSALGVISQHENYMRQHLEYIYNMAKEHDINVSDYPTVDTTQDNTPKAKPSSQDPTDESVIRSFKDYLGEGKDTVNFTEDDINEMVEDLTWDDIVDLYPEEDLIEEEKVIVEKLSAQARLKKKQSFNRSKSSRTIAKNIRLRRASTPEQLKKRAMSAARRSMYKKMLRGRNKATMSASEKDRIEAQIKRMKNMTSNIAMRMVPKMRSIEQKRLAHYRAGK